MKVTIRGREISVDDHLVETYQIGSGKFNDAVAEFNLEMNGVDIDSLNNEELEKALRNSLIEDIKTMEYLSRPEVREELFKFVRQHYDEE